MPALARADRLTEKASRIGFDWPDAAGARAKVAEELAELDEAIASGDRAAMEHELGDALFALANLARKLAVAPEEALRGTIGRFVARFEPRGARAGSAAACRTAGPRWRRWTCSGTRRNRSNVKRKPCLPPPVPDSPQALGKVGG